MAVALSSSSGVAFHLQSPSSPSLGLSGNRVLFWNRNFSPCSVALPIHRPSRSVLVFARGKNRKGFGTSSSSSPSPKKNKKKSFEGDDNGGGDEEDDPFEALFNMLEEDLKNDSVDDKELTEEELEALAAQLAEALGVGDDDLDGIDLFDSATDDVVDVDVDVDVVDDDEDEDEDEVEDDVDDDDDDDGDERPSKLKNWQLRRLAYALKAGKRKTSIKTLAAELCLDRAYVLELLRNPPPKLLMLSATLPDEKPPVPAPENSSPDPIPAESSSSGEDVVAVEPEEKVEDEAVHVKEQRWAAQKRVKKAHIETLEKVYRRSKRPTNAVVSSIVQVTNLPRKRVLKWFEDRRAEDGVPENRAPYQAPV